MLCAPPTHRRYRDIDSDRVITSGTEPAWVHHLWRCQGGPLPEPVKLRERVIIAILSNHATDKNKGLIYNMFFVVVFLNKET